MGLILRGLLSGVLCLTIALPPYVQGCDYGWFGDNCEFMCHCDQYDCDSYGKCNGESSCVKGWFGPSCQYVDLTATKSVASTPDWLSDGDDSTCNYGTTDSPTVKLTEKFSVNWIRITVAEGGDLYNIAAQFLKDGKNVTCNQASIDVSATVKDIRCDQQVTIDEVKLTGQNVKFLCSVQISGGQNFAPKQATQQSSTNVVGNAQSSNAVDGNTKGTCTRTTIGDTSPQWSLMLSKPETVNRFVIYNNEANPDQLKGFQLTSYNATSDVVFEFKDTGGTALPVYNVKVESTRNPSPISKVTIKLTAGNILSICEFEAYGDCSSSNYGLGCTGTCAEGCAACNADGLCYSCLPGWMGPNCDQECPPTYYGEGCTRRCSWNCLHSYCDRFTGKCNACTLGKKGDKCDEACSTRCLTNSCNQDTGECGPCIERFRGPTCSDACLGNCEGDVCLQDENTCVTCEKGFYGLNPCSVVCNCPNGCDRDTGSCYSCELGQWGSGCKNKCSPHCRFNFCEEDSGSCKPCKPGWKGHKCDTACEAPYYGLDCQQRCDNCKDLDCNTETGKCNKGCIAGWTGDKCDQDCGVGKYGENCEGACSAFCNMDNAYDKTIPTCDRITGKCIDGCKTGYEEPRCEPSRSSNFRSEFSLVIGLGVVMCVLGL